MPAFGRLATGRKWRPGHTALLAYGGQCSDTSTIVQGSLSK